MDQELLAQVVQAVLAQFAAAGPAPALAGIPVEASGRHVHLSQPDFEALFGPGQMEKQKDISQPGQFLTSHRVRLIGPKGAIDRVAVLGPARAQTQVELSLTDAVALGISPPVRQSGNLAGSADIHIQAGSRMLFAPSSTIVAARHLHMTPQDAITYGVQNGQLVDVLLESARPLILRDVLVRADSTGKLGLHIDFDEANAAGVRGKIFCKILRLDLEGATPPPQAAPPPKPEAEYLLAAEGGKSALLTGRIVAECAGNGIRIIRTQGRVLVTAQARDMLREKNIELRQA